MSESRTLGLARAPVTWRARGHVLPGRGRGWTEREDMSGSTVRAAVGQVLGRADASVGVLGLVIS